MKRSIVFILVALAFVVVILGRVNEKQNEINHSKSTIENTENAQIANPASVNCIEKGGKLSIVDKPEGQVGMCTLSNGTVCEEWAYFRGECQY